MENNGSVPGGVINATPGVSTESAEKKSLDPKRAYIDINGEGWITATIHISKGLYQIIGFLAEVQDVVRIEIAKAVRRAQEKDKIVKPGFRGFNLFKK